MDYKIEEMRPTDWEHVVKIYKEGINTGKATFQNEIPAWEEWNISHINCCRLVARLDDKVIGWAALSPTSSRCVYRGVAEVSIYVDLKYAGQGVGTKLLKQIIKLSEENGFWTLQSGIIKDNTASIKLHKKCGFREIGIREKVGKMGNGIWHDVVLMERRSRVIGLS